MVVLDTDAGVKLILLPKGANTIEVFLIQKIAAGSGVRFELKDTFLFPDMEAFIALLGRQLKGDCDYFVFPAREQEQDLTWEFDGLGVSGYLVRVYFYNDKVKCSFIIDKDTLKRFYDDLRQEFTR
ncbi:hypothetical protein [Paenibacillus spongiae]|uniref:Uncharacterized protein n=1 Tax=Paenibacillus spongiae TaxID=2909671 RepID=A0ABY5SGX4_9BACL|nr:hypothetical protein [Paenibacillus spongiae]UVI32909.1 hypothetical protein L1F29_14200 [Paenibacillus spongiae]